MHNRLHMCFLACSVHVSGRPCCFYMALQFTKLVSLMYSVTKLLTVILTSVQYLNAALSCKVVVLFLPFPLSLILYCFHFDYTKLLSS